MAFPIHPSKSDRDLMYSVLYDDFTAENAIHIISILDKEEPFPDPAAPNYRVKVAYRAGAGGSLQGETTEWVKAGTSPTQVPFVTANRGYEFTTWTVNGEPVDPETYIATRDTEFVAVFIFSGVFYNITFVCDTNGSIDDHPGVLTIQVAEGEYVPFPDVTPNEGFMFDAWYDGAVAVTPGEETAQADTTYTARF